MQFPPDFKIGEKYRVLKSIGRGSFGEVFLGQDIVSKTNVAIKIEESKNVFSQLTFESKVYRYLSDGVNIPAARLYNIDENRRALVMKLLGPSLEELHRRCTRRFSLKTVCLLADQMLSLLEYLHIRCILHRDIKPDNFLMGISDPSKVYIVDFGLAKQYCISRCVPHVKYNNKKCMIGTARYASINAHIGIEQSRRDDLESLGYVMLYFYLGQLPWQGITGDNKNRKYDQICERKLSLNLETLCRHSPTEFRDYVHYVRHLRFDQRPDYMYLRQLFRQILQNSNLRYDNIYDWTTSEIFSASQSQTCSRTHLKNETPKGHAPPFLPPKIEPFPVNLLKTQKDLTANVNLRQQPNNFPQAAGQLYPTVFRNHNKLFTPVVKLENRKPTLPNPTSNRIDSKQASALPSNIEASLTNPDSIPSNQRYNLRSYKKEDSHNMSTKNTSSTSKKRGVVPNSPI
ncbi:hypothetical protein HZS_6124 [Henneguya salminicola]|nr:hypothetical protein HZS_6124 [Henneguya salminicola]